MTYKTLGPGLLESVYEEALVFELEQRGLKVERQRQVPILYKGNVLKTDLRLDLLVEDQVIVELKSVEEMKKVFSKQLLTYLRLMPSCQLQHRQHIDVHRSRSELVSVVSVISV